MDNILNYVYKKIQYKEFTDLKKHIWEEQVNKPSLHNDLLWTDPIPANPPTASTTVVDVVNMTMTPDVTAPYGKVWKVIHPVSLEQYRDFISPVFGRDYTPVFTDNDGKIIYVEEGGIDYIFDYDSGVLFLNYNPEDYGYTLPIKIKAYRYIGQKGAQVATAPVLGQTYFTTEDLQAGDFVNVYDDGSGNVYMRLAIANDINRIAHGFVTTAVTAGNQGTVYGGGYNDKLIGLTVGAPYYLSDTQGGKLTLTPPTASGTFVQELGYAFSTTILAYYPKKVIYRS